MYLFWGHWSCVTTKKPWSWISHLTLDMLIKHSRDRSSSQFFITWVCVFVLWKQNISNTFYTHRISYYTFFCFSVIFKDCTYILFISPKYTVFHLSRTFIIVCKHVVEILFLLCFYAHVISHFCILVFGSV